MLSFLQRLPLKKITIGVSDGAGLRAQQAIAGLLEELPDLLMTCVVEVATGRVLASYTTHSSFNPNQISLRYAKFLRTAHEAYTNGVWPGGPLTDASVILEDQLHYLRPMNNEQWYGFLAVRLADANLGMAKEIVRRHYY